MNLLIVWAQLEGCIHLFNGFWVILRCLVQQCNVYQHIYLIQLLLGALCKLKGFVEILKRLFDLAPILSKQHAHVVVWEERV